MRSCNARVVVVSSIWRLDRDLFTHARLKQAGYAGEFGTPWRTHDNRGHRGQEIQFWLDNSQRQDVDRYAIVDDNSDMLTTQADFFVKTSHYDGLEREHVERLVAILNGDKADD